MNILIGIDLSDATKVILKEAQEIAKALSARVWLLHVAEPEADFVGFANDPEAVRDTVAKSFHDEHRQVQAIADQLREAGLESTALLIQGPTVDTILREAEKLDAGIIVVGSHGHGMMYQLLVGSVSEGVLHKSGRPVLVIPTHERN